MIGSSYLFNFIARFSLHFSPWWVLTMQPSVSTFVCSSGHCTPDSWFVSERGFLFKFQDTEEEFIEDCFTDIMDDEIVSLSGFSNVREEKIIDPGEFSIHGNSTPPATPGIRRQSRHHVDMSSSEARPSQGTAHRRIKLEMKRMVHSHEIPYTGIGDSVENVLLEDTVELGKGMKRGFLLWKVRYPLMFKAVAYLALMVSLLLLLRAIWRFARLTTSIMLWGFGKWSLNMGTGWFISALWH